jgi:hypothetical protein
MTDYYPAAPETEARMAAMLALAAEAEALVARMPAYDDGVQTPISAETRALVREAAAIEKRIHDLRRSADDWREGNALVDAGRISWEVKSRRLGLSTTPLPVDSWRELPARMLDPSEPVGEDGPADPAAYAPGDLVVVYSRGGYREAIVVSTGKSRIEVAYTTASAVRSAIDHGGDATVTRKNVKTDDLTNHRPAPRATMTEEVTMSGQPDPKPSAKTASKKPIPSDDVNAVDAAIRETATKPSKARSKKTTTAATKTPRKRSQAASKPETAPETAPEPIRTLPARDETPAVLAEHVIGWVEDATEATLDRVASPSGADVRLRVAGTTIAYMMVGKRGVSFDVKSESGKYERTRVNEVTGIALAGRAIVAAAGRVAKEAASA